VNRTALGIILTLVLISSLSLPAFAQAIAESVMLSAGSATGTVKAGSALSSAFNQSSKQLAGRVEQHVLRPPQIKTQTGRNLIPKDKTARAETRTGAMIVSIQGAEPICSLTKEQTATPQGKGADAYPTRCSSNVSVKPESRKYSSVVTLSRPKMNRPNAAPH